MNRRSFLNCLTAIPPAFAFSPGNLRTRHLIFIVNSGARKKDYYEDAALAPNIRRLAQEAFVFEEDHCERVASHTSAFRELILGRENKSGGDSYPSVLDYIGNGSQVNSIDDIPHAMELYRPRVLMCRDMTCDAGHDGYELYLQAVSAADHAIGRLFDWVKSHSYFSNNTAIVIRPEFGRDDEVNEHGQLHHSYGFYYTHRVASIFWGPDFNRGVDKQTVIRSVDMAPTLARLFGVETAYAEGRVVPGLFKQEVLSI